MGFRAGGSEAADLQEHCVSVRLRRPTPARAARGRLRRPAAALHKKCGFTWPLGEALEVLEDARPRVYAVARRLADEAAQEKKEKDKMIADMMKTMKEKS